MHRSRTGLREKEKRRKRYEDNEDKDRCCRKSCSLNACCLPCPAKRETIGYEYASDTYTCDEAQKRDECIEITASKA